MMWNAAGCRYEYQPVKRRKQIMANKLKGLAGAMSEKQLAATIRASAQQIWLAGLGAFSTARKEGNKVYDALIKEGRVIQSFAEKAVDSRLRKAAAKATDTRHRLEQVLEGSVARSLKRFGVPTKQGIDSLSKRVVALTALVDKLSAEVSRQQAAAKSAATSRRARTAARRTPAAK
jgi:poly(hydroxyalkanoate) granule-associated protein